MGDDLDDIDFNLPSEGDSDNDDDVPKSSSKKNNKKRSQESEEEAAAEGEAEGEEGNGKKKKKKSKKANAAEPTVKEFESLEAVATHFDSLFRKEVCMCFSFFSFGCCSFVLILFVCAIQQNSEYHYDARNSWP
jgi:hypothetical protein